jgi:hypothetical protein
LEQPNQLKKLKEMKKDDTVRNLWHLSLIETIAVLLGVEKKESLKYYSVAVLGIFHKTAK